MATHSERARHRLDEVRTARVRAAELDQQILAHTQEGQVAAMLRRLLRANNFERWLCGEALDSLVTEASQTLLELSGGQYQLDRDERNELVVIDYADAAARRPVHTLSGGETFQASLALALALSRQVIGLSAGMRDLNSMFLDEGFGTLDEDTLETVGATLERLSADSDRMIGIITHVQALADRAPVRFVVSQVRHLVHAEAGGDGVTAARLAAWCRSASIPGIRPTARPSRSRMARAWPSPRRS